MHEHLALISDLLQQSLPLYQSTQLRIQFFPLLLLLGNQVARFLHQQQTAFAQQFLPFLRQVGGMREAQAYHVEELAVLLGNEFIRVHTHEVNC